MILHQVFSPYEVRRERATGLTGKNDSADRCVVIDGELATASRMAASHENSSPGNRSRIFANCDSGFSESARERAGFAGNGRRPESARSRLRTRRKPD